MSDVLVAEVNSKGIVSFKGRFLILRLLGRSIVDKKLTTFLVSHMKVSLVFGKSDMKVNLGCGVRLLKIP